MRDEPHAESVDVATMLKLLRPESNRPPGVFTLGGAIAWLREGSLTQAELAELMTAQGVPWRREQVLRVEADQRDISAHELLVVAHVLGAPLWLFYAMAGYPERQLRTVGYPSQGLEDVPEPYWPPDAIRRAQGYVRAYMRGDTSGRTAVDIIVRSWRDYETRSGRPPGDRAERAKRARLRREYEADPDGFRERALDRAIEVRSNGEGK